jgi:hypothetical protein
VSVTPHADMKRRPRSISLASASYRSPAGEVRTKSLFQSCTRRRLAMPAPVSARSRFMAAPALAYARIKRDGSGTRASGVAISEFTMSPR